VNSGFRCEADQNCAFRGYCTASSSNSLPIFRDPWRWDRYVVPKRR